MRLERNRDDLNKKVKIIEEQLKNIDVPDSNLPKKVQKTDDEVSSKNSAY